jgi:phenylacetic acid degradation operon negative regulatory protein
MEVQTPDVMAGEDVDVGGRHTNREPLATRQERVLDLVERTRPVSARDVLASALLGAKEPWLPASHLVAVASLFGISPGAARTCLWRMVTNGELTTDQASYALAGWLLQRRNRVDDAARSEHAAVTGWDGTWELAVVSLDRRGQMDRLGLRKAAASLLLTELREGVWTRPNNLDPARLPDARGTLQQQCVQFSSAHADLTVEAARNLFGVANWAEVAQRLIAAMATEASASPVDEEITATLSFQFSLSVAVVHHLELDPLLPVELLPHRWPAEELRLAYRAFDRSFQQQMEQALQ